MTFFLTFVLNGEIYQQYLYSFSNQFYYFDISNPQRTDDVQNMVFKLAEDLDIGVFKVKKSDPSPLATKITVTTSVDSQSELEKKFFLKENISKSLFSGLTELKYENYVDQSVNQISERYYFIGTKEQVIQIRTALNARYDASFVHEEESTPWGWASIGVFLSVSILIIYLTWLDLQFSKKEIFVRFSLGESKFAIVIHRWLTDVCVSYLLLMLFMIAFQQIMNHSFHYKEFFLINLCIQILSLFIHICVLKMDMKEVLYGANINPKIVSNGYIIKVFSVFVILVSLSTNIALIKENIDSFRLFNEIKNYDNYRFINVVADASQTSNDVDSFQEQIENEVFFDCLLNKKINLLVSNFIYEGKRCIFTNDETVLNKYFLIEPSSLQATCVVVCPSEMKKDELLLDTIKEVTTFTWGEFGQFTDYEIKYYNKNVDVMYFDSSENTEFICGFGTVENPILIYCDFSNYQLENDVSENSAFINQIRTDIMYEITNEEIEIMEKKYPVEKIESINVVERCEQYKTRMQRIMTTNFSLAILLLILETCITVTAIKTEYMVNAKLLALKKILGYSALEKNKETFLLNVFSVGISLVGIAIVNSVVDIVQMRCVFLLGLGIVMYEMILTIFTIIKIEQTNVSKILKGGSL